MHVTRVTLGHDKLVYILVANKKLKYSKGRSRIAYIGTTKKGAARFAASVAKRAPEVLGLNGVNEFDVRVVTCRPRQHVKTWFKLEAALAMMHKDIFGEVPKCNKTFHKKKWTDQLDYFTKKRLKSVIEDLA